MTVGTGFFGRSSLTENLEPKHLVQWTRLAYDRDPAEAFGSFSGLVPWEAPAGPVPPYPVASNLAGVGRGHAGPGLASPGDQAGGPAYGEVDTRALRETIRRIVIEELAGIVGGPRG
jgi:hypothetical protein